MNKSKWEWFGLAYTILLIIFTLPMLYFAFQLYLIVPELRLYYYIILLVPIIGFGTGIYGLIKTKKDVRRDK